MPAAPDADAKLIEDMVRAYVMCDGHEEASMAEALAVAREHFAQMADAEMQRGDDRMHSTGTQSEKDRGIGNKYASMRIAAAIRGKTP